MTTRARPLSKDERTAFERAKLIVSNAQQQCAEAERSFAAVGQALAEIRERELYRETPHKTFEAFCQAEWGMTASRSRQLREATASVTMVTQAGLPCPASERVVRELVRLEPKQQVQAWRAALEAAGDKSVTAAIVKRAAETVAPRAKPRAVPRGVAKDVQAALAALDKLDVTRRRHFLWLAGLVDIAVLGATRDDLTRAAVDGFAILGLPDSATESDVRRAQKEAARVAHPDRGGTQKAFARITQAARDVLEWFAEKV